MKGRPQHECCEKCGYFGQVAGDGGVSAGIATSSL
jgi:hypothetical protein